MVRYILTIFLSRVFNLSTLLNLSSLNIPLSSSSTTSRKLLLHSLLVVDEDGFDVGEKVKKIAMYW